MLVYNKNPLIILYGSIFVVMIGFGLTLPVLPFYIERLALADGVSSSLAATHVGLLTGVFALMQFFFAPQWGKWSDQVGRRPLILIGLAGYAISMICFGMGTNLLMLYGARITGGIFSAAILPAANAYVSDVTSFKERGRGMAWLGSAISLGVVVGPALGGILSQFDGLTTYNLWFLRIDNFSFPFFATALLGFLGFAAALFWLPESLKSRASANRETGENTLNTATPRVFIPSWLRGLLAFAIISQFALATFEGTFALHAQQVLGYGPSQMGVIFVICGLVMALAQGFIISWLIDIADKKAMLLAGFTLSAIGLVLLTITENDVLVLLDVALFAFGIVFITPVLATLISNKSGHQSGAALGYLNSANSIGQAGGPAVGGFLFTYQYHLPYLFVVFLLSSCVVYLVRIRVKSNNKT